MIVRCNFCDKEFYRSPSAVKGSRFCSKSCWYSSKKGKPAIKFTEVIRRKISESLKGRKPNLDNFKRGKDHPNWRGGNIEVICLSCSRIFFCKPSRVRKYGRKYCSSKCFHEFQLGRIVSKEAKIAIGLANSKPKMNIECKLCGKQFKVPPHRANIAVFCSKNCQIEAYRKLGEYSRLPQLHFCTPNKKEWVLNRLLKINFPHEWKFVGNGKVIIERKNPDFININGKKQIIELFGKHWHEESEVQPRTDLFAKYGYKTLILWDTELSKSKRSDAPKNKKLIEKIISFMRGGD